MSILSEFKDFAMKGNVVDLAVGVIIGGAFGKIVSSLVADVLMPLLGILTGGVNFSDKSFILKAAEGANPEVVIKYGAFLQSVVDFTIIAFSIFMMIKALNAVHKKKDTAPATEPTTQEKLLAEIRDLLKTK